MASDRDPIFNCEADEMSNPVQNYDMYGSMDNTNNSCNVGECGGGGDSEKSYDSISYNTNMVMEKNNNVLTKPLYISDVLTTTIDDVLYSIGQFGRYQKYQYFLLCLVSIVAAFQAFNMVFIGDSPVHHCTVPVDAAKYNMTEEELLNHTIPWEPCSSNCASGSLQRSKCSMYNLTVLGYDPPSPDKLVARGLSRSWVRTSTTPTTECIYGWTYSEEYYTSTIVSQVRIF